MEEKQHKTNTGCTLDGIQKEDTGVPLPHLSLHTEHTSFLEAYYRNMCGMSPPVETHLSLRIWGFVEGRSHTVLYSQP